MSDLEADRREEDHRSVDPREVVSLEVDSQEEAHQEVRPEEVRVMEGRPVSHVEYHRWEGNRLLEDYPEVNRRHRLRRTQKNS